MSAVLTYSFVLILGPAILKTEEVNMDKHIFIVAGAPGSGKSTWIRKNVPAGAVVCSADHWFEDSTTGEYRWNPREIGTAHRACMDKYVSALSNEFVENIVVDNTNTKPREMKDYVRLANDQGITPTVVYVSGDPAVAAARNVHGVGAATVQRMHDQLEQTFKSFPPTSEWGKVNVVRV